MSQLFRVKHKEAGDFIDERWGDDTQHLESHLLIGPTGRVFWLQWDGLKDLTAEVEVQWTARADAQIAALQQSITIRDTEIARLETDLELARRDADRYRFIKSQESSVPGECRRRVAAHVHDWARSLDPAAQFNMWSYEELSGDRLDVEIDKARAGNGVGV